MTTFLLTVVAACFTIFHHASSQILAAGNLDRFNYRETVRGERYSDYAPRDWINVRCQDLGICQGWPDHFENSIEWGLERNDCRWCPASGNSCGVHHQSPINLERNRAIEGHPEANECIDVHWMFHEDGTCEFEELQRQNSFTIERHALKIIQPIEYVESIQRYRIGCRNELGRRWAKIDFSRGFSDWWHLSHIDVHLPSEHTQEGKRYDGELQMYHVYSVSGRVAGVNNELASVTTFLEAYDDVPDYDVLNRIICAWRRNEEKIREACGLPSVVTEYPGCYYYGRGHSDSDPIVSPQSAGNRRLRSTRTEKIHEELRKPMSYYDLVLHNHQQSLLNASYEPILIEMSPEDYEGDENFDWDAFIADVYAEDEMKKHPDYKHRHLVNYDHVGWFNYFPLIGCRTEYYYRYGGTQTVPPCYGRFTPGSNRGFTNNWRIMKDPIRISRRQLLEMHRLLRERIAPPDDPLNACLPDTAALVDPVTQMVNTSRPLMSTHRAHHKVFCECENWRSKWKEDQDWCTKFRRQKLERFYEHPYNFYTEGF